MIKKINIFLVLLLLFVAIGAVSAADDGIGTEMVGNEAIQDTLEVSAEENIDYDSEDILAVDESSSKLEKATYTVTQSTYSKYFDSKGNLIDSKVSSGDIIKLSGAFSNKSFIFNKTVNIEGDLSKNIKESTFTFLSGASGSTISNLKIINTKNETYGIFLNSASKCTIQNCFINNTGKASYCICLGNAANYNTITGNDLNTYGVTYGHNQRSTPPLVLSGSNHNTISNNKITVDDANGIYLSSYAGGPLLGGESHYNLIKNNTINYNVLPTSWSWGIQVMGSYNRIDRNTVNGAYRGISTSGYYNNITNNKINRITGADYNNPKVEIGGEYGIVASYNSYVANNKIAGAKIISTGAGITASDNSIVEKNNVEVTLNGRGIVAAGSNVIIKGNVISTVSGSGVYQNDDVSGLVVENNRITSVSGIGILIEKLSSKRMPKDVTIKNNTITTANKYAIDASGVQKDTAEISSNNVGTALINTASGIYDASKPTYNYKGTTHNITTKNFDKYINANGGLTSEIKDGDILNFKGTFENKVIYLTKGVKVTGNNPKFINSTFKVTSGNVWIENLTIENSKSERVNAWGIYVNQASGVKITNNRISVRDPKAAYAIYVLESTYVDVFNNDLTSEGDYLTFTLLAYGCEDCNFTNNRIHTKGTGDVYNFRTERCIDGAEVCIDGNNYCVDGNELYINGVRYCLDGDGNYVDPSGVTYCVDGNEICIDGKTYCLDGNEVCIDGQSVCIDGNEVFIGGNKFCLDGNEVCIDGVTYNNKAVTVNGTTYRVDGNNVIIGDKTYCFDGNEVCIDGVTYDLTKTVTVNGTTYCIDGNEVCIDGQTYCFDGNEVCIDGKTYCFDGNEHKSTGAHVVSEIYQTYGILLLYSSNNFVSGNDVDVSSKLSKVYKNSTNSIVGIDLYFNSHNNTFVKNNVHISSNDNYIYGMGVLGYTTGHSASNGQGATNNAFIGNTITLEGVYCVEGIIVGDESEDTIIDGNVLDIKSKNVVYGIYFEMSHKSTAKNNILTLNSDGAIYGIIGYSSNDNVITNNTVDATAKAVYGVVLSNGKNNRITDNKIDAKGTGKAVTFRVRDSIEAGNAGIYLHANSTNTYIENNVVKSAKEYAVLIEDVASGNTVVNNNLNSEKGISDKAVYNSKGNKVSDNYAYVASATTEKITVPYLGTGVISIKFDTKLNGANVTFYDADGKNIGKATVSKGVASVKYAFGQSYKPAQYIFTAKLSKANYKSSTYNINVNVEKADIAITAADVSIKQGGTGNIVATVLDEHGNPVKGKTVAFYRLNSAGKATIMGNAVSNAKGVATLSYKLPSLEVGTYKLTAKVTGDNCYNGANVNFNLKVTKQSSTSTSSKTSTKTVKKVTKKATKITAAKKTFKVKTKTKKYTITLKSGKKLVKNAKVTLKVNGKTYKATTNKKGKATFKITKLKKKGKFTAYIKFKATKYYKASSKKVKITVKK